MPAPVESPKPVPEAPAPTPTTPKKTEVIVTKIESLEGEAFIVDSGRKSSAAIDAALRPGQSLQTAGGKCSLKFADGTRVSLWPETELRLVKEEGGKAMFVARGELRAEVAPQPAGQPLLFTTPHGQAKVLGTTLRLHIEPGPKGSTRLDVEEGKVEFKRLLDGKLVTVTSGLFAVAASGTELALLRPGEILLLPSQAAIVGDEWRMGRDARAVSGFVFENGITAPTRTSQERSRRSSRSGSMPKRSRNIRSGCGDAPPPRT